MCERVRHNVNMMKSKKQPAKLQPKTITPPFCQSELTLYPVYFRGKLVYVTVPE
jgi:hypothetical protein